MYYSNYFEEHSRNTQLLIVVPFGRRVLGYLGVGGGECIHM